VIQLVKGLGERETSYRSHARNEKRGREKRGKIYDGIRSGLGGQVTLPEEEDEIEEGGREKKTKKNKFRPSTPSERERKVARPTASHGALK